MLDKGIIAKLEEPFDESRVKTKTVPNRPAASYLESYDVIKKANEVFGYGGWGTRIVDVKDYEVGGKTACMVVLELMIEGALPRQDVGVVVAAQSRDKELTPEALETALKGAASDALKRAFRHFGTQFGNDLYDKERNNGKTAARPAAQPAPRSTPQPARERTQAEDAAQLKRWLEKKAEAAKKLKGQITENQIGYLNGLLCTIFGAGELDERDRHAFLDYIFGVLTSKQLTKAQASALIEWAKDGDEGEVHPIAKAEAQVVLRTYAQEHGQQEMPL